MVWMNSSLFSLLSVEGYLSELFSVSVYYKYICCEHSCASLCMTKNFHFLGSIPWSEISRLYDICMLSFCKAAKVVFRVAVPFYIPTNTE